jgi:hypothetical protein
MCEALGAAAFSTATYTFVADIFPDNMGAVLVRFLYFSNKRIPNSNVRTCLGFVASGSGWATTNMYIGLVSI